MIKQDTLVKDKSIWMAFYKTNRRNTGILPGYN